jgi:hypothetical protein
MEEDNCMKKLPQLQDFIKSEMRRQLIPDKLTQCSLETLPYNLLLCKLDWPTDIMEQLPSTICGTSCNEIKGWNDYHNARGEWDYPKGWKGQIEDKTEIRTARRISSLLSGMEYDRDGLEGLNVLKIDLEDNLRKKRQHGVLPRKIPPRFVKEFVSFGFY